MKFQQKKGIMASVLVALLLAPTYPAVYLISKLINPNKKKILELLSKNKKMTIAEIKKSLKISYKETYRHIKELVAIKVLSRKREMHEGGRPVYISLTPQAKKEKTLKN